MVRPRNFGVSNKFSEGHRKFLPAKYRLWDIDGFFYSDDRIEGIYEGKYRMYSNDRGNFIETFNDERNLQANFLKYISNIVPVWICEESTQKWWNLKEGILSIGENPDLHLIKTENRIYVEESPKVMNKSNPHCVFYRTEGEKPCSIEKYAEFISSSLNVNKIAVNDVHNETNIYFKKDEEVYSMDINESQWAGKWMEMNLI